MIKLIKLLFLKEIKRTYFKIFALLVVCVSFLMCYLNYKNYENNDSDVLIVEEKLLKDEYEEVYPKGDYDNYLVQYEKYIDYMQGEVKLQDEKVSSKLFVMDNIFTIQVFISILGIIIGALIITREFNNGVLKLTMTKGISRVKVFLSFFIVTLLLIIFLNILLFICFIVFLTIMHMSFELFTLKVPVINSEIKYVSYLLTVLKKFIVNLVPVLFISAFSFMLSTLFFSSAFAITVSMFLVLFSLLIYEWLLGFNIKLLTYTFMPYLDFTIFYNKLDIIMFNMKYGVDLNITSGVVYLIIYAVIFAFISLLVFVKRDIK